MTKKIFKNKANENSHLQREGNLKNDMAGKTGEKKRVQERRCFAVNDRMMDSKKYRLNLFPSP